MLRIELSRAHLCEDGVQHFLIVCSQQEPMLVDMRVELLNHLWLVPLEVSL